MDHYPGIGANSPPGSAQFRVQSVKTECLSRRVKPSRGSYSESFANHCTCQSDGIRDDQVLNSRGNCTPDTVSRMR